MDTKPLKAITVFLFSAFMWATPAQAKFNKVLCEVDKYSVRVVGDVPDGVLKYIVFNYQSEKTTIVPNGDYSADSKFHYYDFILHGPPSDTIVEVAASKLNPNNVYLRVWEYGSQIYNKKCTFGKRLVGDFYKPW
ncbi:MAG: hypothetical protein J7501_02070 [Bdellovibrio sp.]|nr:hypothetical protein [Bdellovibrio sp.]